MRETPKGIEATISVDDTEIGNKTLAEARAGKLKGLSLESNRARSRIEGGIRVISHAMLFGIGIVKSPSYSGTAVEVREAKPKVWIT